MKRLWYLLILLPIAALVVAVVMSSYRPEPKRGAIVSLTPNVTEILFELGLADSLVGISTYCDYPSGAKDIQCIGDVGNPNIEMLLSLEPKLIIATNMHNEDVAERIRNAKIKLINLKIDSFQELYDAIELIGKETDTAGEAVKLIARLKGDLEVARLRFEKIPNSERPRVFVEIWDDPLQTVGGPSFINEIITCAGGVNVAGQIDDGYPRVNPEMVVQWDPDVILMGHGFDGKDAKSQFASRIGWSKIKAVRDGRIIDDIDSNWLLRPGPRLVDGVKALAERLHPNYPKNSAGETSP